jgi:hypothetical protein
MEQVKERYVDGIGKIHFCGGVVRFDLYSFQPTDDEKQAPQPIVAERLIMSPNGFLASYDAMVNMIQKLTDAGVIQKRDEETAKGENEEVVTEATTPIEG